MDPDIPVQEPSGPSNFGYPHMPTPKVGVEVNAYIEVDNMTRKVKSFNSQATLYQIEGSRISEFVKTTLDDHEFLPELELSPEEFRGLAQSSEPGYAAGATRVIPYLKNITKGYLDWVRAPNPRVVRSAEPGRGIQISSGVPATLVTHTTAESGVPASNLYNDIHSTMDQKRIAVDPIAEDSEPETTTLKAYWHDSLDPSYESVAIGDPVPSVWMGLRNMSTEPKIDVESREFAIDPGDSNFEFPSWSFPPPSQPTKPNPALTINSTPSSSK